MEKPNECKICRETQFKFHEELYIYNPETDEEELIFKVYQCINCEALHFDTEEYECVQYYVEKNHNVSNENVGGNLANYMKS